jgi:hypothetical protein
MAKRIRRRCVGAIYRSKSTGKFIKNSAAKRTKSKKRVSGRICYRRK